MKISHRHTSYENGRGSPEWCTWSHMKARCLNPNHEHYARYGGRGITVCARWNTFENFLTDMGPRPNGKTLDRFPNNDGNYEPGNCRWATRKEQARNRSSTRFLLINGAYLSMKEASEVLGFHYGTIKQRLRKGWSPEQVVNAEDGRRTRYKKETWI